MAGPVPERTIGDDAEPVEVERERLWNGFRDHDGWGDVEALAKLRSMTTAVVVLEPR